jgi:hypothetical protein
VARFIHCQQLPFKQLCSVTLVAGVVAIGLVLDGLGFSALFSGQVPQPSLAQPAVQSSYISPETVSNRLYQQLPSFPKEDQYKPNNKDFAPSTLVERLVQYHTGIKGRNPRLRFDWKLTLADYLGLNELMPAQSYPGREYLARNPLDGDRAVVRQLSRQQRQQLVQTLVNIYTPPTAQGAPVGPVLAPAPTSTPPVAAPKPQRSPLLLPNSRGGDAQLLTPPTPATPVTPQPPRPTGDAQLLMP